MDDTHSVLYLGSSAGKPSSTMQSPHHGSISNNISSSNNFFINSSNGFSEGEIFHGSASSEIQGGNGGGMNFTGTNDRNDEVNVDAKQKNKNKKQRFAFQTRSQVDILDDGYRWRKYGQKAVKNNAYPRNYYKCTHQGCNVKKQVQRLDKDETVVVTTYEGVHTHSIAKPSDNFQQILSEMKIFPPC
ncbi:putative WRKY transcription factor 43 [Apium graveolens]|uniref:putative WRKY transcription factor 43 n=1 Tax=Apium graveolens TaxID=4045 RepID=UPI003D7B0502